MRVSSLYPRNEFRFAKCALRRTNANDNGMLPFYLCIYMRVCVRLCVCLCVCSLYDRCHLPRELQPSVTLTNLLRYTRQRNSVTATDSLHPLLPFHPFLHHSALYFFSFSLFLSFSFSSSLLSVHFSPFFFFKGKEQRRKARWTGLKGKSMDLQIEMLLLNLLYSMLLSYYST